MRTRRIIESRFGRQEGEPFGLGEPGPVQLGEEIYRGPRSVVRRAFLPDGRKVLVKSPSGSEEWQRPHYRREFQLLGEQAVSLEEKPLRLLLRDDGGLSWTMWLGQRVFPVDEVMELLELGAHLLQGLQERDLVHNQVEPDHLIWSPARRQLWLVDYSRSCAPGSLAGQPDPSRWRRWAYLAPEQSGRWHGQVDFRTDLYGLGASIYHLLTGHPPFAAVLEPSSLLHALLARQPDPPQVLRPETPAGLTAVLTCLLAKDPEHRYQDAAALLNDLQTLKADPRRALRPTLSTRFRLPRRLYGRASERQLLSQAWSQVCQGRTLSLCIQGEEGVGKTALAEELRHPVLEAGGLFLSGGLRAGLRTALRQLLAKEEAEVTFWREKLRGRLGRNAGLLGASLPELSQLLGVEEEAGASRERLQSGFLSLLGGLAGPAHPLLVLLDGEPEDEELLNFLAGDQDLEGILWLSTTAPLPGAQQLNLKGLPASELALWLEDAGICRAGELAQILQERTGGNPWRVSQALQGRLERGSGGWEWQPNQFDSIELAPGILQAMRERFHELPDETRRLLGLAACLGRDFEVGVLVQAAASSPDNLEAALRDGWLLARDENFELLRFGGQQPAWMHFPHSRLREAAYESLKNPIEAHWLLAQSLSDERAKVEQWSQCMQKVPGNQQAHWASMALRVGQEALRVSDFDGAFRVLKAGWQALREDGWDEHYLLLLDLSQTLARVALIRSELTFLKQVLLDIRMHGRNLPDQLAVWTLGMRALLAEDRWGEAFELSDEFLLRCGRDPHPRNKSSLRLALSLVSTLWALRGRGPDQLRHLATATDPVLQALQEVQTLAAYPHMRLLPETIPLGILRDIRSVLKDGITAEGSQCWTGFALMLCNLGQVSRGQAYAQLAMEQAERLNPEVWPRVALTAHYLIGPYTQPLHHLAGRFRQVQSRAMEVGDRTNAINAAVMAVACDFFGGRPLNEVDQQIQRAQQDYLRYQHRTGHSELARLKAAVDRLRLGREMPPDQPTDRDSLGPGLELCLGMLMALVFGDQQRAMKLACANEAPGPAQGPTHLIYWTYALVVRARASRVSSRRLPKGWRRDWVEASRKPSIMLLDRALEGARREGYLQDAALICEQAADFCQGQARFRAARVYREEAMALFEQWGASAKLASMPAPRLDMESVLRASRVLAAEIDVNTLVARLLELALESAGAEWGCVILHEGPWRVVSSRNLGIERIDLNNESLELPTALLRYALRTRMPVVVEEGVASVYAQDAAIRSRQPRSILCLPLEQAQRVAGLLYLENNLAAGVFTPERLQVLGALSAQMAVSLENAQRFQQLQRSQAEVMALSQHRHAEELRNASLQARKEGLAAFLGIASHDLKTPLAAIQMWARQGNHQEQILQACQRADSLISTYLDVAALESGSGLRLQLGLCDLTSLVEAEIDFQLEILPAQQRRQAQLSWELESAWLEVDPERFRQVLANLLGNALKHCPPGTPIHVSLRQDQTEICLEVIDQGPGVAAEGLFQPFERRSSAGTGLGLWIARLLVEAHGGRLTLVSPPGCHFTCSFPRA